MSLRAALAAALLGLGASGCGYSSQLRLPAPHHSVGVEVFGNDSPAPELERSLYAALDDAVATMVSAELRAPDAADVVVRGRIVDYWRLAGVFGTGGQLQESGVTLHVVAWLLDRETGQRLGAEVESVREVRYAVGVGAGAGEDAARELALRTLAQELVLELFSEANLSLEEGAEPALRDEAPDVGL
ncbi:MAG: hypothetical protein H6828_01325 [Planctomycetes bacterium]|nr:hypothetical protein [Planctomycetota bacterium]